MIFNLSGKLCFKEEEKKYERNGQTKKRDVRIISSSLDRVATPFETVVRASGPRAASNHLNAAFRGGNKLTKRSHVFSVVIVTVYMPYTRAHASRLHRNLSPSGVINTVALTAAIYHA